MIEAIAPFVTAFAATCLLSAGFILITAAAEIAYPGGKLPSVASRLCSITFAAISILATIAAIRLFEPFFPWTENPVIRLEMLPDGVAGQVLAILLALLFSDLLYYWFHRAQHTIPMLWRVHAVHHSVEEMGAGANYHHFMEPLLKAPLVIFPTALVVEHQAALETVASILMLHAYYAHSATRLNFGSFARIVLDNRTHRLHHSRQVEHFNKNFGGLFLIWDWVFGTAVMPRKGEWPETGISEYRELRSVWDFIAKPFRGATPLEEGEGPALTGNWRRTSAAGPFQKPL